MTKHYKLELTIGEIKALRNVMNDAIPAARSRAALRANKMRNKGQPLTHTTKETRDLKHLKNLSSGLHEITEEYDLHKKATRAAELKKKQEADQLLIDSHRGFMPRSGFVSVPSLGQYVTPPSLPRPFQPHGIVPKPAMRYLDGVKPVEKQETITLDSDELEELQRFLKILGL